MGQVRFAKHQKRLLVFQLGMVVIGVALFGIWPAGQQMVDYLSETDPLPVDVWAILVLWWGILQISYVVYMLLVPDLSSLWVVTLATAISAFSHAMALGFFAAQRLEWSLIPGDEKSLAISLGLADEMMKGRATLWTSTVLILLVLATYLLGRSCLRWQRSEQLQTRIEPPFVSSTLDSSSNFCS